MEHSCYQCGAGVEDGIPFCRQCRAPQIRVAAGEGIAPAEIIPENFPPHYSAVLPSVRFDWAQAARAAALAGLLAVILMFILRQAFALAMISSGFLVVYLYRRKNPFANVTTGTGALLGAMAAVFGTILIAIACAFVILGVRFNEDSRAAVLKVLQQQIAQNPDPQAQKVLDSIKTPEGFTLMMIVGLLILLVFFIVLSSLGGAIAAALARRKQRL